MNHRLWEAYDTRANHDVPRFSAALDFSISILDISGHVTYTLVVLLSNVRETLHSMRVDELSGLLSLSLSLFRCVSLRISPSFLKRCPRSSNRLVGNKAVRHVTGPLGVRVKCVYNVVHALLLIAPDAGQFRCLASSWSAACRRCRLNRSRTRFRGNLNLSVE